MAQASPVTPKFLMAKWAYIVREEGENEAKMQSFDVSQVYDPDECYLNDFPSELKFSEGDRLRLGFLIGLGYRIYFKCISSAMYTNEGKFYQAGFFCIRVPTTKSIEDLVDLFDGYDYTYQILSFFLWPVDYLNYD